MSQDRLQTNVALTSDAAAAEQARQAALADAHDYQAQAKQFLDGGASGDVGNFAGPDLGEASESA